MKAKRREITAEEVRALLRYEPSTGYFFWLRRGRGRHMQDLSRPAGCVRADGYRHICIGGEAYMSARLAWFYVTGSWPKEQIDHRNRNRSDDRWDNLREATHAQNQHNRGVLKNNTSGFEGVSFHRSKRGKNKLIAHVVVDGELKHLAYFFP